MQPLLFKKNPRTSLFTLFSIKSMAELPDFLCVPSIGLFFKSHPPLFFLTFNQQSFVFYLFKYIYLFILAVLGLHCSVQKWSAGASWVAQLVKKSTYNAGDPGLIPELGRSTREGIGYPLQYSWASLVAQLVKNPSAIQKTLVWSLEEGMATCSSILAWRISRDRGAWRAIVHGVTKSQTWLNELAHSFQLLCKGFALLWFLLLQTTGSRLMSFSSCGS